MTETIIIDVSEPNKKELLLKAISNHYYAISDEAKKHKKNGNEKLARLNKLLADKLENMWNEVNEQ